MNLHFTHKGHELTQVVRAIQDTPRRIAKKILPNDAYQQLKTWREYFKSKPPMVDTPLNKVDLFLSFSTHCNYACVFCNREIEKRIVKLKDIRDIDELVTHVKMVDITGYGDVTTHPEFPEILKTFTDRKVPIRFVTNGSLIKGDRLEAVLSSTIDNMVISVNSLNPETYSFLHNSKVKLETVLENIENLFARKPGFRIIFSFVINSHNFKEIRNFIDFGKKYGATVNCMGLTPTLVSMYPPSLEIENNKENRAYLEELREYAAAQGVNASILKLDNQSTTQKRIEPKRLAEIIKGCDWVYTKTFIETDGTVKPCCWSQVTLGDIKTQSFDEIWHGEKYEELRTLVKQGSPKHCSKCRRLG